MDKNLLEKLFISPTDTIRTALVCIDKGGKGIALIVDGEHRLVGTVSDGDIRRAMLAGIDLESLVTNLLKRKTDTQYAKPITASIDTSTEILLFLMRKYVLDQIPILDNEDRIVDLMGMDDFIPFEDLPLQAMIMAGGFGSRLRPLTDDLPKPMLPVGGKPLMETLLGQLRDAGIRQASVTTHFQAKKITDYFGDGEDFGVRLNYVNEKQPLGTGGALGLIPQPSEPILVINGDVLTQINFRAMLSFHQKNHADMSVAVRKYDFEVPYGVVESDGVRVTNLQEKPHMKFFVNAGIYLLEPTVFQFIPNGERFNMTDLIQWLIDADRSVVSFPIREYWIDIGQHADYVKAQEDMANGFVNHDQSSDKTSSETI
ncbi:MAG: nucleotidyltransferase family protein [Chloroflexi bacterium]|nr:nucleotidyltransferase family protein [Chloroflexota bacterium]